MQIAIAEAHFRGVGHGARILSPCTLQVKPGTLGFGIAFLNRFGLRENESLRKVVHSTITVTLNVEGGPPNVQLVGLPSKLPTLTHRHTLCLEVEDIVEVALRAQQWWESCGLICSVTETSDHAYHLLIPPVFGNVPLYLIAK